MKARSKRPQKGLLCSCSSGGIAFGRQFASLGHQCKIMTGCYVIETDRAAFCGLIRHTFGAYGQL